VNESAYSTDDRATVAAYVEACDARRAAGLRAVAAADALGHNKGPAVRTGMWGIPDEITALFPDDATDPQDGWTYLKGRDLLVPRRGKAGDAARTWLNDHQLGADPRVVLAERGLPYNGRRPKEGSLGSFYITRPKVFVHDDTLWALYTGEINGDCTWTPRRLSEFHTAFEAYEDAEKAKATDATDAAGKAVTA
jgi:hypothetical protein